MQIIQQWKQFQYKAIAKVLAAFLFVALILFIERGGVRYHTVSENLEFLTKEQSISAERAAKELKTTCLVLADSRQTNSVLALEQFEQIFLDMKVGWKLIDVSKDELPSFEDFETVVVLMGDISPLQEHVLNLADWVYRGGSTLFAVTLEKESYLSLIEQKLGITASGYEGAKVESIYLSEEFAVGGGQSYSFTDPFDSAWAVAVGEQAKIYAWTDDERKLPLIWTNAYGEGVFAVDNIGIYEKMNRGLYAATYSLLTDACAYPVINGSTFYLDDFPSPVPSGDGTYVRRDYNRSIADFYTNIWWPDVMKMGEDHGVVYTGVIIENYEDDTDGTIEEQTDTHTFQYYGNMLLRRGGEIGYHGYNHQPLSLNNVDYGDVLPYNTWDSREAMEAAMKELMRFEEAMFPGVPKSVYVPPSNVLSAEGRELLGSMYPAIRTIASNFLPGDYAYVQEFGVAEDGIVEQPRTLSGCMIDDYMQMTALSELNMHFVSNHFMHPDDLLDVDRGAALGWEVMRTRLNEYMDWLYHSAPMLRRLTGSGLSGAVQRYAALTVEEQVADSVMEIRLGNFYDEAYLMVRINKGKPGKVTGGSLEHLTGNLYLLQAQSAEITVQLQ